MKQRVEAKSKTLIHMDKNRKELWSRVDLITEKVNRLGKEYGEGKGKGGQSEGLKTTGLGNRNNEEWKTSEEVCQEDLDTGRDTRREKKYWCYDDIKVRCVIWCGNMTF